MSSRNKVVISFYIKEKHERDKKRLESLPRVPSEATKDTELL